MDCDVFMKIEGPDVKGESSDSKYTGQIEILSFTWGGHVSLTWNDGTKEISPTGRTSYADFSFTKKLDLASPVLFNNFSRNKWYKKVTIEVRKAGGSQIVYDQIMLENVITSGYTHTRGLTDDTPLESISMAYNMITFSYWPQKPDGTRGTVVSAQVNLAF